MLSVVDLNLGESVHYMVLLSDEELGVYHPLSSILCDLHEKQVTNQNLVFEQVYLKNTHFYLMI